MYLTHAPPFAMQRSHIIFVVRSTHPGVARSMPSYAGNERDPIHTRALEPFAMYTPRSVLKTIFVVRSTHPGVARAPRGGHDDVRPRGGAQPA